MGGPSIPCRPSNEDVQTRIPGLRNNELLAFRRVSETAELCRALENDGNVTLLAPRRYGKTGLVMNAFHHLTQAGGWDTVYIDIFGTQDISDFTRTLANAVVGRLDTPLEKAGAASRPYRVFGSLSAI